MILLFHSTTNTNELSTINTKLELSTINTTESIARRIYQQLFFHTFPYSNSGVQLPPNPFQV